MLKALLWLFLCCFSLHAAQDEKEPLTIVIFGASGDLTARKLLPALYHLAHDGKLPEKVSIFGFARREQTDEEFREKMGCAIDLFSRTEPKDGDFWRRFEKKLFYHAASFEDDEGYERLEKRLSQIGGNRIYFLATQPSQFPVIVEKLHERDLLQGAKVMIEKPFGHDLDSAMALDQHLSKYLDDSQVYRMDHFLGKEGIQNILTFRFEKGLFEPIWNREAIERIEIEASEEMGIGTRANLWEETGFLRDFFQNHLLQILSLVAMEPPGAFDAASVHREKAKLLEAIRPFPLDDLDSYVVRGQYGPGSIQGKPVVGYKQENGVSPNSQAETFVTAKLFIDNERWKGVPFFIRGGKRLSMQRTEVKIFFKEGKEVSIRIQPTPGIFVDGVAKGVSFTNLEAYERLFLDAIQGDISRFVSKEELLASWRLLTPVLDSWRAHPLEELPIYEAGTWGPSLPK